MRVRKEHRSRGRTALYILPSATSPSFLQPLRARHINNPVRLLAGQLAKSFAYGSTPLIMGVAYCGLTVMTRHDCSDDRPIDADRATRSNPLHLCD